MTKQDLSSYYKNLGEKAREELDKRTEEIEAGWRRYNYKVEKATRETQEWFDKASDIYLEYEEKQRRKISEQQKKEAIEKAEVEAERKLGIKSEKTIKIDNAYKSLLKGL